MVRVNLFVHMPDGIHNNYGITFDSPDRAVCKSYVGAIMDVCCNWHPFHQSGVVPGYGYQFVEFWRELNRNMVEERFKEIHERAEQLYNIIWNQYFKEV